MFVSYKQVTLPKTEEGFNKVNFVDAEEEVQAGLEKWQKVCKLSTTVDNLKIGPYFKEQIAEWVKVKRSTKLALQKKKEEEKKASSEEKKSADKKPEEKAGVDPSCVDVSEFSDEDWMLADLRVELHLLAHSFRQDVEDKEREYFSIEHVPFYYKKYHSDNKSVSPSMFGVKDFRECIEQLISETLQVKDDMMVPNLAQDASFDVIIQHVEDARRSRQDRLDAGDEDAALRFKAKPAGFHSKPGQHSNTTHQKGKGKGGKGYNGKKTVTMIPGPGHPAITYEMRSLNKRPANFQQSNPKGRRFS